MPMGLAVIMRMKARVRMYSYNTLCSICNSSTGQHDYLVGLSFSVISEKLV